MLETFDLVLMVNHACNLRCAYCYTGAKFWRSLNQGYALRAVNRALRSIAPGGTLELGRFHGSISEAEIVGRAWLILAPGDRRGFVNP
ncbi:MAG: hypothetical protein WBF93_09955 [Pirellulales bacterium]|nr:hypothetical protein [Pirellulales bacterium]